MASRGGIRHRDHERGKQTTACHSVVPCDSHRFGDRSLENRGECDRTGDRQPWWVVNTINGAVNKLTVGLDLDGLNDGESNMMAFSNKALNRDTNCQDYLYVMHQQYDTATSGNGGDTSSITKAVNRMWEETALRSWVTMQWGNPSAGPNTPSGVAATHSKRTAMCLT